MPIAFDVDEIIRLFEVDLYNMVQPIILSNPFVGDDIEDDNTLTSQPVAVLNHIRNVLRLMKDSCATFDEEGLYHPAYVARIRRLAEDSYFTPSVVNSSTEWGQDDTFMKHSLDFSWDGYDFFVTIHPNGEFDFTHNRAFARQCEFSGGFYDNNDWEHMNYPLGHFTEVWEVLDDHHQEIEHEPSGPTFNEKMMDTIWYIFYRMYRAGFVNAIKHFDVLPEDEEEEEEWDDEGEEDLVNDVEEIVNQDDEEEDEQLVLPVD